MGKKPKLNLGKLDSREDIKAPVQTNKGGVVKSDITRTTFDVNEELFKKFKTHAILNSITIKDLLSIQIKHRITSKEKVNKDDYVFNEDKATLKTHAVILPAPLFVEMKVWLVENDIQLRDFLNRIIKDVLNKK